MRFIYVLTQPGDVEGRSTHTVGHFFDEPLAIEIGSTGFGNRSMGPSDGWVRPIEVYENLHDFLAHNSNKPGIDKVIDLSPDRDAVIRGRALAKLTDEEKRVLFQTPQGRTP